MTQLETMIKQLSVNPKIKILEKKIEEEKVKLKILRMKKQMFLKNLK